MTLVSNRQLVGNCFRIQGAQPGALEQPRGVGWGAGWKEVSRGRDICILMAALGFPGGSAGKESACNAGDPGSISSLGRSPGEGIGDPLQYSQASLVTQTFKNPPAVQKTWIQSLGWEDPLEEGMASHSSILAWRIPMDRGAWRATVHAVAKNRRQLGD